MASASSFELYRQTIMGDCLCETLEELVSEGKMTQELAMETLKKFDLAITNALKDQVLGRCTIKANLKNYRYYDNVWQFTLEDVDVRLNPATGPAQQVRCDRAKCVCVDAKLLDPGQ